MQTNSQLAEAFRIASLLQILLVKKDPDTLEHFIPIEIGGSGLYYDDPVVVAKRHSLSAVEDEIHYRIN